MRATHTLQMYCRNSKANKQGLANIEVSLIINQKRVFINLPRKEYPSTFKKAMESKRGNEIKDYIDEVRRKFNTIELDMMRNNLPLTAESVREYFKSGGIRTYTVGDLFSEYLELLSKRIGKDLTHSAYKKYQNAFDCFKKFCPETTELSAITKGIVEKFLIDCNSKYQKSTTSGIMTKVKTVFTFAKDSNKIQINPFLGVKYSRGKKDIEYLTEDEINRLKTKEIDIDRLAKVRDIAVFQIASGLAYIDTVKLRKEDIHFSEDGTCYIYKKRQKTNVEYTSVVFPEGVEILKKYDYKLPTISNQKGNAYLKEIQTICSIEKSLHFHLFRKTYATRLLNKGVRLEIVSRALGHSSVKITQSAYSKLLNNTVIDEIKAVF